MIVQIYEVTTPAEACVLGAIGIDHIGVLIGEGSFPREQTIDKAREIFAAIPSGSKTSALALSHDVDLIVPLTAALVPDILHLGGGATAPLASAVVDTESRVSASLADAKHPRR
jgi:phosphoribosylanthranilate isomerase